MFTGELVRSLLIFKLSKSALGMATLRLCPYIEKVQHCEGHLITNGAKLTFEVQPEAEK